MRIFKVPLQMTVPWASVAYASASSRQGSSFCRPLAITSCTVSVWSDGLRRVACALSAAQTLRRHQSNKSGGAVESFPGTPCSLGCADTLFVLAGPALGTSGARFLEGRLCGRRSLAKVLLCALEIVFLLGKGAFVRRSVCTSAFRLNETPI